MEEKQWTIRDWVNVPWCYVLVYIFTDKFDHKQQDRIFYQEAIWKGKSSYSGLFSNLFEEVVKKRTELYGAPVIVTKTYSILIDRK